MAMREVEIKRIVTVLCLAAAFFVASSSLPAAAQTAHQSGTASPDAWISHQMNQPPPGAGDRYDVSPDRLDEIRELYKQARQEQNAKQDPKPQDKK
jgi:hypothetical protein